MGVDGTTGLTAAWTQYDDTFVCRFIKDGEEVRVREYDHAHAWEEMQQDVSAWLDGADIG